MPLIGRMRKSLLGDGGLPAPCSEFAREYAGGRTSETDLAEFGVEFDRWYSEASIFKLGPDRARPSTELDQRSGTGLHASDGALWFKAPPSTGTKRIGWSFGTMANADLFRLRHRLPHREKFERGFDRVIDVWGAGTTTGTSRA